MKLNLKSALKKMLSTDKKDSVKSTTSKPSKNNDTSSKPTRNKQSDMNKQTKGARVPS